MPALSVVSVQAASGHPAAKPARHSGPSSDLALTAGSASLAALILSAGSVDSASPASDQAALAAPAASLPSVPSGLAAAPAGPSVTRGAIAATLAPVGVSAPAPAPVIAAPPAPAASSPAAASHPIVIPRSTATGAQQGIATWLRIPAGTCANNGAPMGSVITVTNSAGVSVTCKVISRGPFVTGRIVDLAEPTFARLGAVSQGLVAVTVTW